MVRRKDRMEKSIDIWEVTGTQWGSELIVARTVDEALRKFDKHVAREVSEHNRKVQEVASYQDGDGELIDAGDIVVTSVRILHEGVVA